MSVAPESLSAEPLGSADTDYMMCSHERVVPGTVVIHLQLYEFHRAGVPKVKWVLSASGHGEDACDGAGGLLELPSLPSTVHNLRSPVDEAMQTSMDFVHKSTILLLGLACRTLGGFLNGGAGGGVTVLQQAPAPSGVAVGTAYPAQLAYRPGPAAVVHHAPAPATVVHHGDPGVGFRQFGGPAPTLAVRPATTFVQQAPAVAVRPAVRLSVSQPVSFGAPGLALTQPGLGFRGVSLGAPAGPAAATVVHHGPAGFAGGLGFGGPRVVAQGPAVGFGPVAQLRPTGVGFRPVALPGPAPTFVQRAPAISFHAAPVLRPPVQVRVSQPQAFIQGPPPVTQFRTTPTFPAFGAVPGLGHTLVGQTPTGLHVKHILPAAAPGATVVHSTPAVAQLRPVPTLVQRPQVVTQFRQATALLQPGPALVQSAPTFAQVRPPVGFRQVAFPGPVAGPAVSFRTTSLSDPLSTYGAGLGLGHTLVGQTPTGLHVKHILPAAGPAFVQLSVSAKWLFLVQHSPLRLQLSSITPQLFRIGQPPLALQYQRMPLALDLDTLLWARHQLAFTSSIFSLRPVLPPPWSTPPQVRPSSDRLPPSSNVCQQ
ncbi:hypothetical protein HPB47_012043 [Ixodes persulcatus]|uniref:Uncharacterized protein n=1 Tax=Ixodes persulcatus TaxID=34615 RepID=A0AC60NUM5_IXOPE|nr:hypothetical protein HPB47_012043 [Ixodes persulcatus]